MSQLHRLCAKAEVPTDRALLAHAPDYEPLAVCRVGDAFYVVSDTCSHGLASLSEGEVYDGQIVCPFHAGAFDIVTGKATERPCVTPITTYPVIEQGDDLYIAAKS